MPTPPRVKSVIRCCCRSHNFIIDEEDRDSALPETHVHRRADGATVVDGGGSPVVWLNSSDAAGRSTALCGTSETGLGIRVGEATWVAGCAIVFATQ
ncbi:hypothetical protein RI054_21g92450 [Pseudoscourfieldia marina]